MPALPGAWTARFEAARAADGGFTVAYLPSGKPVSVALDRIAAKAVKAQWVDPRTGAWSPIGELPNSGAREFAPPTRGEKDDWVLVLEDPAKKYPVEPAK